MSKEKKVECQCCYKTFLADSYRRHKKLVWKLFVWREKRRRQEADPEWLRLQAAELEKKVACSQKRREHDLRRRERELSRIEGRDFREHGAAEAGTLHIGERMMMLEGMDWCLE